MKEALDYLNLPTKTRNQLLSDIKKKLMTEKKVIGMVSLLEGLNGKHCMRNVGLFIEDSKYVLKFTIDDMSYRIEY